MKATSLSINVRAGCNARCPFCISRTTISPSGDNEALLDALSKALRYAAYHRVDTVLITSGGEPLTAMEAVTYILQRTQKIGIPINEVQTNGKRLGEKFRGEPVVDNLAGRGVNLVAISAAAMDSVESAMIMGLPDSFSYLYAAEEVIETGMMCRVTLNLTRDFELRRFDDYVDRLVDLGVHQLTLRMLGVAETDGPETESAAKVRFWVENNKLEDDLELALIHRIARGGHALRTLPHGGYVYDYRGLAVVPATCLTETRDNQVRSLILQPDGGLYHSWQHEGSRIL